MGGGLYSTSSQTFRALAMDYATAPISQTFKSRSINNAMNPKGIVVRESRDNAEHPNSLAVIFGLDVTGSMGKVPHNLVKDGLPTIMQSFIDGGILDPQVLFLGIGDHECDDSPLQVGQFESSDELLDKWLTDIFLEGGGGGNAGESYHLAWYFAAQHTAIDCLEKRAIKGFLFTIGDEPVLDELRDSQIKSIMGEGQYKNWSAQELLTAAREKYNVYHIHIAETMAGRRQETIEGWTRLIGAPNLLIANSYNDVANLISTTVISNTEREARPINILDI